MFPLSASLLTEPHWPVVTHTPVTSLLSPQTMAQQTRDGGVDEECKYFSPHHVPTTNSSSTRLPLGSLDLTPQHRHSYASKTNASKLLTTKNSACIMLAKNVDREALLCSTWVPLILLLQQVNTGFSA